MNMVLDSREIKLRFDMNAYEMIEDRFGSYEAMQEKLKSDKESLATIFDLAAILHKAAADYEDVIPQYSEKKLRSMAQMKDMKYISQCVHDALMDGFLMDTRDRANDKPRDLVLEELESKKKADD